MKQSEIQIDSIKYEPAKNEAGRMKKILRLMFCSNKKESKKTCETIQANKNV